MPEIAYYALYDVQSERFIRFGLRLSTDQVMSYWLDDISGVVFNEIELDLIVHWARTGDYHAGQMCYHFIKYLAESVDIIKVPNLICVPCDEHFTVLNYNHAFPILEL